MPWPQQQALVLRRRVVQHERVAAAPDRLARRSPRYVRGVQAACPPAAGGGGGDERGNWWGQAPAAKQRQPWPAQRWQGPLQRDLQNRACQAFPRPHVVVRGPIPPDSRGQSPPRGDLSISRTIPVSLCTRPEDALLWTQLWRAWRPFKPSHPAVPPVMGPARATSCRLVIYTMPWPLPAAAQYK
jgi:hypothetical protein